MNARAVSAAAGVIHAAMATRSTAAGIAAAVDAAGLLMSPEVAAEFAEAKTDAWRYRTAWRIAYQRAQGRGWAADRAGARARELQTVLQDGVGALLAVQMERDAGQARVEELETERHSTNEALDSAVQALRARDARITELEQLLAVRTFYLADSEGVEGGPTLHTTVEAAKTWADEVEPGDWFEDDGVWVQCDTDPDTDRPTTRGAGTVTPLTVQGDGILAEAERLRQTFAEASRKLADLQQVRADELDVIRELQTQQGEVMKALGCGRHDEWDDVVHRARQLAELRPAEGGERS